MPTAARLFAALAFLAVGFFTAETARAALTQQAGWGNLSAITAALGWICGWQIAGPAAGAGMLRAMASGLRTSLVLALAALVVLSVTEMVRRTLRERYDGVFDAVLGIFDLFIFYAVRLIAPEPMAVLIVGGILGGAAAEWAARRWS